MTPIDLSRVGATVAAAARRRDARRLQQGRKDADADAPRPPGGRASPGARAGGQRPAQDRLRLRRPGRRRRLDVRARQRAQGAREAFRRQDRHQLRREGSRGGRRRARVPRHGRARATSSSSARPSATWSRCSRSPPTCQGRQVRARHRLQDRAQHAHLRQPHLRRRLHGRRDRRRHDQDQHPRRRRLDPDPRGDPQHQQLHAGRAVA